MTERGSSARGPDAFNVVSCRLGKANGGVEEVRHGRPLLKRRSYVAVGAKVVDANSGCAAVGRCQERSRRVLDLLRLIVDAPLHDGEWFGTFWIAWRCICRRTSEGWITPTPGHPARRELGRRLSLTDRLARRRLMVPHRYCRSEQSITPAEVTAPVEGAFWLGGRAG